MKQAQLKTVTTITGKRGGLSNAMPLWQS